MYIYIFIYFFVCMSQTRVQTHIPSLFVYLSQTNSNTRYAIEHNFSVVSFSFYLSLSHTHTYVHMGFISPYP